MFVNLIKIQRNKIKLLWSYKYLVINIFVQTYKKIPTGNKLYPCTCCRVQTFLIQVFRSLLKAQENIFQFSLCTILAFPQKQNLHHQELRKKSRPKIHLMNTNDINVIDQQVHQSRLQYKKIPCYMTNNSNTPQ